MFAYNLNMMLQKHLQCHMHEYKMNKEQVPSAYPKSGSTDKSDCSSELEVNCKQSVVIKSG